MLLTKPKSPSPPHGGGGPLSSRGGTLMIAALLSLVAAGALLLFLREYRDDLTASDGVQVLVARSLVPKGTPGEVVAEKRLYKLAQIKKSQLEDGALTDPDALKEQAATADLFPGHQLTVTDFEPSDDSVRSRLAGFERAMAVPVDGAHGMVGKIDAGDRVDVITTLDTGASSATVAQVAVRNVLVLGVPDGDGSGVAGRQEHVTIRVPDEAVPSIAKAADGGQIWLVLRPAVGARSHETDAVIDGIRNGQHIDADVDIDATVRSR
jgi:Flp pilus assembly protein CpaB